MKFDVLPNVFHEPYSVSTLVGYFVLFKRFYRGCPISLPNRVTLVELVELDILDFDVILRMDRLHSCFASIDFRTLVIMFQFPHEPVVEWKEGKLSPKSQIIYFLKAYKLISKGCLYHIVRTKDI